MSKCIESKTIELGQFKMNASVFYNDEDYSIVINIADMNSLNHIIDCDGKYLKYATITNIDLVKKNRVMSKLEKLLKDYTSERKILREIDYSEIMYQGMNNQTNCDCCDRNVDGLGYSYYR